MREFLNRVLGLDNTPEETTKKNPKLSQKLTERTRAVTPEERDRMDAQYGKERFEMKPRDPDTPAVGAEPEPELPEAPEQAVAEFTGETEASDVETPEVDAVSPDTQKEYAPATVQFKRATLPAVTFKDDKEKLGYYEEQVQGAQAELDQYKERYPNLVEAFNQRAAKLDAEYRDERNQARLAETLTQLGQAVIALVGATSGGVDTRGYRQADFRNIIQDLRDDYDTNVKRLTDETKAKQSELDTREQRVTSLQERSDRLRSRLADKKQREAERQSRFAASEDIREQEFKSRQERLREEREVRRALAAERAANREERDRVKREDKTAREQAKRAERKAEAKSRADSLVNELEILSNSSKDKTRRTQILNALRKDAALLGISVDPRNPDYDPDGINLFTSPELSNKDLVRNLRSSLQGEASSPATPTRSAPLRRQTKDGRTALFDADTKEFLGYEE